MADVAERPQRTHPKTGEQRHVRRALRLDRLPEALLERIRAERAAGRTWEAIERDSPQWPEWEQVAPEVCADFPDRRLPHSNLQRWYDLRVEQVRREQQTRSSAAHAAAELLTGRGFTNLNAAARNALGEAVFRLMAEGAQPSEIMKALTYLSRLLVNFDRSEIASQRLAVDKARLALLAHKAELAPRQKASGDPATTASDEPSGDRVIQNIG